MLVPTPAAAANMNGAPTSHWHNSAYGFSPVAVARTEHKLAADKILAEKAAAERAAAAARRRAELEAQAALLLDQGEDSVESIFDKDWQQVKHCLKMLPVSEYEIEKAALRKALLAAYQPIRDVFRYYSSLMDKPTSSGGYYMCQNEFVKFLFDAQVKLGAVMPQGLFNYACSGNRTTQRSARLEMSRVAFLEAIAVVPAEVNAAQLRAAGSAASAVTLRAELVEEFLDMYLLPLSDTTASSAGVRTQLKSQDVLPHIIRGTPYLKAVFKEFADVTEDDEEEEEDGGEGGAGGRDGLSSVSGDEIDELAMTDGAFLAMLVALGVLPESEMADPVSSPSAASAMGSGSGGSKVRGLRAAETAASQSPDELTKGEALQAFKLAQSEDEGGGRADMPEAGLDELDFGEFIEAAAHLALAKWKGREEGLGLKYAWLVDMVETYCEEHGLDPIE